MRASAYLGDLGGLAVHRAIALLDLRGTGESAIPADTSSYRCHRQVDDIEALRAHLGLDRIDLMGHSAGAALVLQYAARHPNRLRSLVLITPSPRAVGIDVADADRRELVELRRDEPWFPDAYAAFEKIWSGQATDDVWDAIVPFTHGRWDATAQALHAADASQKNEDAAAAYYAAGAPGPDLLRSAFEDWDVPVLVLSGGYDVALPPKRAAEYAGLFGRGELIVQSGAGHYPWLDDPDRFVATLAGFAP